MHAPNDKRSHAILQLVVVPQILAMAWPLARAHGIYMDATMLQQRWYWVVVTHDDAHKSVVMAEVTGAGDADSVSTTLSPLMTQCPDTTWFPAFVVTDYSKAAINAALRVFYRTNLSALKADVYAQLTSALRDSSCSPRRYQGVAKVVLCSWHMARMRRMHAREMHLSTTQRNLLERFFLGVESAPTAGELREVIQRGWRVLCGTTAADEAHAYDKLVQRLCRQRSEELSQQLAQLLAGTVDADDGVADEDGNDDGPAAAGAPFASHDQRMDDTEAASSPADRASFFAHFKLEQACERAVLPVRALRYVKQKLEDLPLFAQAFMGVPRRTNNRSEGHFSAAKRKLSGAHRVSDDEFRKQRLLAAHARWQLHEAAQREKAMRVRRAECADDRAPAVALAGAAAHGEPQGGSGDRPQQSPASHMDEANDAQQGDDEEDDENPSEQWSKRRSGRTRRRGAAAAAAAAAAPLREAKRVCQAERPATGELHSVEMEVDAFANSSYSVAMLAPTWHNSVAQVAGAYDGVRVFGGELLPWTVVAKVAVPSVAQRAHVLSKFVVSNACAQCQRYMAPKARATSCMPLPMTLMDAADGGVLVEVPKCTRCESARCTVQMARETSFMVATTTTAAATTATADAGARVQLVSFATSTAGVACTWALFAWVGATRAVMCLAQSKQRRWKELFLVWQDGDVALSTNRQALHSLPAGETVALVYVRAPARRPCTRPDDLVVLTTPPTERECRIADTCQDCAELLWQHYAVCEAGGGGDAPRSVSRTPLAQAPSAAEHACVESFLKGEKDPCVQLPTSGATVSLRCLRADKGDWLDSDVLSAFCMYIAARSRRADAASSGYALRCAALPAHMHQLSHRRTQKTAQRGVLAAVRAEPAQQALLMVINLGDVHWVLLCALWDSKELLLYDSLRGNAPPQVLRSVLCALHVAAPVRERLLDAGNTPPCRRRPPYSSVLDCATQAALDVHTFAQPAHNDWRCVHIGSGPIQQDRWSCGLHVLAAADCISRGEAIHFPNDAIRMHNIRCNVILHLLRWCGKYG